MADSRTRGLPTSVTCMAELGALFEAHWHRLVEIARQRLDPRLGTHIDAEDLVNAAFLDARRRWADYRANPRVSTFVWLYRIVNDRVIEEWRKATAAKVDIRKNVPWPQFAAVDLVRQLVAQDTSPSQVAIRNEEQLLLRKSLDRLPESDREILRLRCFESLCFSEIGEILGITENTATIRYIRALKRLKDAWRHLTGESRQ